MNRRLLLGLVALLPLTASARPKPPPPPPPVVEAAPVPVDPLATMPTVGPVVSFSPPTPEVRELSNHVPVWVIPSATLPIFTLVLTVPGGSQLDAAGHEGTAALAMEAMRRGAGDRTGPEFAAEVERRGLTINGAATEDGSYLTLSGPVSQLEPGLDLLADLVLRPKLTPKEIRKARDLLLAGLQQSFSEPTYVAARTAQALYWGTGHPYGRPSDGTEAGLKASKPADVKRWVKSTFVAGGAGFTVAGAVDANSVITALNARFGAWTGTAPTEPVIAAAPVHDHEPIFLVDVPDSAQTAFYVAFPGPRIGDPVEAPTRVGTIALGGTFTSRLNALLREKRGYTYGVKAGLSQRFSAGNLVVRTRIRTDVTAPALTDLLGELKGIQTGISAEELGKAQGAARQDVVEELESQGGVAGTYAEELSYNRSPDTIAADLRAIGAVQLGDVTGPLAAWNPDHAVFVLVGDQKVIEPKLREAGYTNLKVVSPL